MSRLDPLLLRLARPQDRDLLRNPNWRKRLRILARAALRHAWAYVVVLLVALVWVSASGMDVYHRTEMPEFCNACHEMGTNFESWSSSRHGGVKCIDCHARTGLSGWVEAKTGGMAQLYTHLTAETIKDIHLEQKHEDIVSENCERCHTDTARAGDRRGRIIAHRRHDELGVACVSCHSGNVAHPSQQEAKDPVAGLVDLATCFDCHDGKRKFDTAKGPVVAFAATDEPSCATCHPDAKFALAHGEGHASTVNRKPCLDCHEARPGQRHYALDARDQGRLCARCHEDTVKATFASVHEPFGEGRCDACHKVMAPAYLFRNGPEPSREFCLGCHESVAGALALPKATTLTAFADGDTDLHRQHAEDVSELGSKLCQACHAGHGSQAQRGLVFLRPAEEDGEPGTFKAKPTGGSCAGSCHDGDKVRYDRRGEAADDEEDEDADDDADDDADAGQDAAPKGTAAAAGEDQP